MRVQEPYIAGQEGEVCPYIQLRAEEQGNFSVNTDNLLGIQGEKGPQWGTKLRLKII